MPIKWRSKILLAKIESTYGVDPTPSGANGILATQVSLTPMEGNDVDRELELPYLGAQGTVPVELHSKLAFNVELAPSGTAGTAPAWGPLLRACAVAETIVASTSVTYNPVSDSHESIALYVWVGGTQYVMLGTRGTCTMEFTAQGIPYLKFEFTGLFKLPSEQPRVAPALGSFQKPQVVTSANTTTFTINSIPLVMRSCMLNLGNAVEPRFLVGSEGILITDKSESVEATVEAVPLTTLDPYQMANDQTSVPVSLVHGVGAGKIATLSLPTAQMQRPQGLENAQDITEWPLRMVPVPTVGNDQWTLTLT
jgi:hypothetical protein